MQSCSGTIQGQICIECTGVDPRSNLAVPREPSTRSRRRSRRLGHVIEEGFLPTRSLAANTLAPRVPYRKGKHTRNRLRQPGPNSSNANRIVSGSEFVRKYVPLSSSLLISGSCRSLVENDQFVGRRYILAAAGCEVEMERRRMPRAARPSRPCLLRQGRVSDHAAHI